MLNLSRALSSKDIVYNTDMENIFNAFAGLESQRLSLGGLTITPESNGTKFLVEKADGTDVFAVNTSTPKVTISSATDTTGKLTITAGSDGDMLLVEKNDGTDVLLVNTSTPKATITGALDVSGFTKLGDNAIKIKKYTGTTSDTEGGTTDVAHGLTGAKILALWGKVINTTGGCILPNDSRTGYQYALGHDATNIRVLNDASNSENILSKTFYAIVLYEE